MEVEYYETDELEKNATTTGNIRIFKLHLIARSKTIDEIKWFKNQLDKIGRQPNGRKTKRMEYLTSAKDMLNNAKYNLCMAVSAFEKTGLDFEETIKEIKQVIGDLECSIVEIENIDKREK